MKINRTRTVKTLANACLVSVAIFVFAPALSMVALAAEGDVEEPGLPIRIRLEWIEIPMANLWKMIGESPSPLSDHAALHRRARAIAEAGEGKIVEVVDITGRAGEIAKHEEGRGAVFQDLSLVRSYGGWKRVPRDPKTASYILSAPYSLNTRNVGTTVEVKIKKPIRNSGTWDSGPWVNAEISAQIVEFGRWSFVQSHHPIPAGEREEITYKMSLSTTVALPVGEISLVGVMSPQEGTGRIDRTRKVLLFVRPEAAVEKPAKTYLEPARITLVTSWVDVSPGALSDLMANGGRDADSSALEKSVRLLVAKGEARVREIAAVGGGMNARSLVTSVEELKFPSYYEVPWVGATKEAAPPGSFAEILQQRAETLVGIDSRIREVGTRLEAKMSLWRAGRYVNHQMDPKLSAYHGDLLFGPEPATPRNPPVPRPIFSSMESDFEFNTLEDGRPVLAAVSTPRIRDGDRLIKDPKWRTMVFVRSFVRGGWYKVVPKADAQPEAETP